MGLSRADLASRPDMTPETFCCCLHGLAGNGAVRVLAPDRIERLDMRRLRQLAGPPLERLIDRSKLAAS